MCPEVPEKWPSQKQANWFPICLVNLSSSHTPNRKKKKKKTLITNPGTTPITILAVNSDHGLSFAGEETRTMLSEFPLQLYSTFEFWRFKFSMAWVLVWVSRAAKRGGFKRGGFPIWTCPSFFVLFGTFPFFPGFSRFAWGLSGDFPDLFFSSFSALLAAPTRNSPERVRDTIWTFPKKKWETPRFGNPPV